MDMFNIPNYQAWPGAHTQLKFERNHKDHAGLDLAVQGIALASQLSVQLQPYCRLLHRPGESF